jgi:GAF domain-containing protein
MDAGDVNMNDQSRERRLNAAFVTVADTLTDDYDVVELLHTLVQECTEILDAQAGGLMLADAEGELQLVASTSQSVDVVEVMQLDAGAGPCLDCFATGEAISIGDIAESGDAWPVFRAAALAQGFVSVHATPLQLRGNVIGTMNLFGTSIGALSRRDADVAQALADVATIGILHERLIRQSHVVAEQLQRALDTRILVEQAKGVLAQAGGLDVDEAFSALRRYARDHNLVLRTVAEGVVNRRIDVLATSDEPSRGR